MDAWPVGAVLISGLLFFVIICASIVNIRRDHAHHVYAIWYIFCCTSCLLLGVLLYLHLSTDAFHSLPTDNKLPLYDKLLTWFIAVSTDVKGELNLISVILFIAIVPQTMSFVFSGLFGCGSPPILVSTITRLMIFSLIKFFCVLSGIITAIAIFQCYLGLQIMVSLDPPYIRNMGSPALLMLFRLSKALLMLSLSFGISAIYYKIDILWRYITDGSRYESLHVALMYMTRFHQNEVVENQGWVDLAKIYRSGKNVP